MSNGFGFGFSFPLNGDDNNDHGDKQHPFGSFGAGGGLGDMLNQFGAMFTGMDGSGNAPDSSGPVNYDMVVKVAHQRLGNIAPVSADEAAAVAEAVRLVELWLDDATGLPASNHQIVAWNASQWLENTLPQWKRLATPVAEHTNQAQLNSLPEQAREMMGGLAEMMQQFSGMSFSMSFGRQLGGALADLARQALTGADFGLPVSPTGVTALLPQHIKKIAAGVTAPEREVMVYIAAREAARQRLFAHVPWLVERIVSSVEEYAMGLKIDTSHLEEVTRSFHLEAGDPQSIQDALSKLQGMDFSPRITSTNALATTRLETLLALVEGWVDVVVFAALQDRIPATAELAAAWARRSKAGGNAENALSQVISITLETPRVEQAAELWRRATVAVGAEKRDTAWEHPDFLPATEHLDHPAAFIDGLLDDQTSDAFEQELAKLEEMLRDGDSDPTDEGESS